MLDSFRRMSGVLIKFRRKGGFRSGVSLGEAMANVRLSGNDSYTFQELNVDSRGRIILKIRVSSRSSDGVAFCADLPSTVLVVWLYLDDLRNPC